MSDLSFGFTGNLAQLAKGSYFSVTDRSNVPNYLKVGDRHPNDGFVRCGRSLYDKGTKIFSTEKAAGDPLPITLSLFHALTFWADGSVYTPVVVYNLKPLEKFVSRKAAFEVETSMCTVNFKPKGEGNVVIRDTHLTEHLFNWPEFVFKRLNSPKIGLAQISDNINLRLSDID